MQKLFKQLSDTKIGQAEPEVTDPSGAVTERMQSNDDAVQQLDFRSDSDADTCTDLASPRSEAASSQSCLSLTGSVLMPATPGAANRLVQPGLLDSTDNFNTDPVGAAASQDVTSSDDAGNVFGTESGLDAAIQACSDLIGEIKDEMDRKGKQRPGKVLPGWKAVCVLCVGSAIAMSSGAITSLVGSELGMSATNWFPT